MARCNVPPAGWYCTREAGHDGPCAAHPYEMTGWASPSLGRAYEEVERLRANLAQHPESGIDEALRRALDAIEAADIELMGIAS
jgi:hypothetical protein